MSAPGGEVVDLVDESDRVVGEATIGECLEKGLLHRAVAVLVIRGNGKYLLQRRSTRDIWHPGLWTLSSTGHVKKGESYDAAAKRELWEEIGIDADPAEPKMYLLPPFRSGNLTEREWVGLYVVRSDSQLKIDPMELEGANELSEGELRRSIASGSLTPDAVLILSDFLAHRQGS